MIDDLEFLRGEATKLQKALRNESGKNYKKYATLFQAYLTAKGNLQQLEAFQKQKAEYKEKDFYRYTRIVGSGTAGNKNHFFQRRCIFCLYRSGPSSKI